MSPIALVDAGALYAAADADDADHQACVDVLSRGGLQLVVPALVIAEATCCVAGRLGAAAEETSLRGLGTLGVEAPDHEDFERMAELVHQYADFPLGGTDASVVALAERLDANTIITLDRRHFAAVRPRHCTAFQLLP